MVDLNNFCPFCSHENASSTSSTELKDWLDNDVHLTEHEHSLKTESLRLLTDLETYMDELCAKLEQFDINYSSSLKEKRRKLETRQKEQKDTTCDRLLEKLDIEEKRLKKCKDTVENVKEAMGDFEVQRKQLDDLFLEININEKNVEQFNIGKYYEQLQIIDATSLFASVDENTHCISKQIFVYLAK